MQAHCFYIVFVAHSNINFLLFTIWRKSENLFKWRFGTSCVRFGFHGNFNLLAHVYPSCIGCFTLINASIRFRYFFDFQVGRHFVVKFASWNQCQVFIPLNNGEIGIFGWIILHGTAKPQRLLLIPSLNINMSYSPPCLTDILTVKT